MEAKKVARPVNQKSIYHSFGDLYEKIMNDEVSIEKAEQAIASLAGMNRTYALEIKRAEVDHLLKGNSIPTTLRGLELIEKSFDEIPIPE